MAQSSVDLTDQPMTEEAADARQEALEAKAEADRVRAEAARQARVATDDAVRVISGQTNRTRIDALARVQVEVDDAVQEGRDAAEVRERAEAQARQEIDLAELTAARRARRAREEAYSRARKETADADRVASVKAGRAAALMAPSGAEVDLRTPGGTVRRGTPASIPDAITAVPAGGSPVATGAAGTGAAGTAPAEPGPVRLGQATLRAGHAGPPGRVPTADAPEPRPGDMACWSCAATNPTSRHFCRRCGSVLVAPLAAGSTHDGPGGSGARGTGGPDWHLPKGALPKGPGGLGQRGGALGRKASRAKPSGHTLSSLKSKSRGVLAVAVLIAAAVGAGHQAQVASGLHRLRAHFAPKPVYVTPELAYRGNDGRPIPALTQTREGPDPFTSTRQSPSVPVFSVTPGGTGGVAAPITLYAVGLVVGGLDPPRHIELVAYGPSDPKPLGSALVALKDTAGFQSFRFEVDGVSRVAVYVIDRWGSGAPAGYVVDQVELFKRT